jgi:hypothetical protein
MAWTFTHLQKKLRATSGIQMDATTWSDILPLAIATGARGMSSTRKGRKVRSGAGTSFPNDGLGSVPFAQAVAAALREEFGMLPAGIKTVARLAGANERAVKNWFQAKNAPSGELLVALCRHSELVLETVLRLAGRTELMRVKRLSDFQSRIQEMRALLDSLEAD